MEWVSSDDITVSAEEDIFKGIVEWVSHNKSEREGDFPQLLHQVRLTSMSHDSLLNVCVKEELIAKNTEVGFSFFLSALKLTLNASDKKVNQQPRKCLVAHTDGVFVCGGRKALCYFPKQNVWYRLADSMLDHNNHTPTQCKSKIYIDGTCKVGESEATEHYIPMSNAWGAMQRGTVPSNFTGYTVFKGELYATYFSFTENGRIYRYDAETNYWDEMKSSPFIQDSPCVVTDEQFLYVISGRELLSSVVSTSTRFDPNNNKWEEVAGINEGRFNAFGAAMNGKVFIAGGRGTGCNLISSCEVYNPSNNEWQLMPSVKVPRYGASMVCFEGRLYVLGGCTYTSGRYMRALTVEVFDSERNEWTKISAIPVNTFESQENKIKVNMFQACFARLYKAVIDKLKPLN